MSTEAAVRPQFEIWFGLALAIFAAALAINDLGAGRYGDDELKLTNEKTSAYLWYQSKGIKESLVEGQRDLLKSLLAAGAVREDKAESVLRHVGELEGEIRRYGKEKKEILLGSRTVGEANWAQDVAGQLGKVIGAQEMEAQVEALGTAGDRFDLANLFLQLALVFGAIGLIMHAPRARAVFLGLVIGLGLTGIVCSSLAYVQAGKADALGAPASEA